MSSLIKMDFSNDNILIWSADDWLKLRKNHRIVGDLIGCLPKQPRQTILSGLPLSLLFEEAKLLIDKGVARLVHYPRIEQRPNDELEKFFLEFREKLFLEQELRYKKEKEKQVMSMMDKIVDGKRRKILGLETAKKKLRKPLDEETKKKLESVEIDKQKVFEEEMAKLPKLDRENALTKTPTACPWLTEEDAKDVDWNYPSTKEEKLRYHVYKDLWERNYYVTSGVKFGGDFLAYPGDPILFHSQFIVHCKEKTDALSVNELVSICRIGSSVRKTQVFASFSKEGDSIEYQSFQWAESNAF